MMHPMKNTAHTDSPFALTNVRMFIAFRVFFNARFYYPVFTIMFLDFGLTIAQFAFLNAVWAATIVIMEVPSGALADIWGRRNLLIGASVLMIVEMLLICLAPQGRPTLLLSVFMINRVLSGTAEAAASGADEAIAFDALKAVGRQKQWSRVLSLQMRLQALMFILAMSIGAAVYDPQFMQQAADWMGITLSFDRSVTIRIPAFLTLGMAALSLAASLKMHEVFPGHGDNACKPLAQCKASIKDVLRQTLDAGKWILNMPFAVVIIAAGFLFDGIIRMVITLSSQYYRLIAIPEALFGIIGSGIACLGLIIPRIAMRMSDRRTPTFNLVAVATVTSLGLFGMTLFIPTFGVLPVVMLFASMQLSGFFMSYYLNQITASKQRATVLSFKGLSLNLSYGLVGLLYSALLALMRPQASRLHAGMGTDALENVLFSHSIQWFPWVFLGGLGVFLFFAGRKLKGQEIHRQTHFESFNEE